jgi:hypothetical protein
LRSEPLMEEKVELGLGRSRLLLVVGEDTMMVDTTMKQLSLGLLAMTHNNTGAPLLANYQGRTGFRDAPLLFLGPVDHNCQTYIWCTTPWCASVNLGTTILLYGGSYHHSFSPSHQKWIWLSPSSSSPYFHNCFTHFRLLDLLWLICM